MKNIFISSTFVDMQAERDLVQERVLPALREEARKYGENVGVIDLRWGVDTSTLETEEGAAKVLQVCLDEIDRSHPYMLIFLGERYGTVMRENQIEKSVRGREDKYTTDDYVKSITALEVEYGALSEKYGELNHCVVCFREPVVHMLDGVERDLYAEHTEEGKRKLEALKERIRRDLGEDDRLIIYSCTWDKSARKLVDFRTEGRPLEEVLIEHIRALLNEEWEYYGGLSWFEKDRLQVKAQQESEIMGFVGREAAIAEYSEKMKSGTNVILEGDYGFGKTSVLYKIEECLKTEGNTLILLCGTTGHNRDYKGLLRNICYYFEILVDIKDHTDTETLSEEEMKEYYFFLSKKVTGRVYIFIDAIDRLESYSQKIELAIGASSNIVYFITKRREESVKNQISFLKEKEDGEKKKTVWNRSEIKKAKTYTILPMRKSEAMELICKGLEVQHRDAYDIIVSAIMEKFNVINPLYISIVLERLKHIGGELLSNASDEAAIVNVCKRCIDDIPDDVRAASYMVMHIIAEKVGEECFKVMKYLAVAKNGLRMEDLLGIFESNEQINVLTITRLLNVMDEFLYEDGNGLLKYKNDEFKEVILERVKDKEEVSKDICGYIRSLKRLDYLRETQGMEYAYEQRDTAFLKELIVDSKNENNAFLIKAMRELVKKHGYDFVLRFIDEQIGTLETSERRSVQRFFVSFLGGVSVQGRLHKPMKGDIEICSKLLTKYVGIEGEAVFELYCLTEVCKGILLGNELVSPFNRYKKKLLKKVNDVERLAEEYEYVIAFFENWERNNLLPYRLFGDIKKSICFYGKTIIKLFSKAEKREKRSTSIIPFKTKSPLYYFQQDIKRAKSRNIAKSLQSTAFDELCTMLMRRERKEYEKKSFEKEVGNNELSEIVCEKRKEFSFFERIMNRMNVISDEYYDSDPEFELGKATAICKKYVELAKFQAGQGMYEELQWTLERVCRLCERNSQESYDELPAVILVLCTDVEYKPIDMSQLHAVLMLFDNMIQYVENVHTTETEKETDTLRKMSNRMAGSLERSGWKEQALTYYEKCLKYSENLYERSRSEDSLIKLADCHKKMGDVLLRELKHFEKAQFHLKKWIEYEEEIIEMGDNDKQNIKRGQCYKEMGDALNEVGLYSDALIYYEKDVRSREEQFHDGEIRDINPLINSYATIGDLLCRVNRVEEATGYFERSLKLFETRHQEGKLKSSELVNWKCDIAKQFLKVNSLSEARQYSERALVDIRVLYEKVPHVSNKVCLVETLLLFARICFAQGCVRESEERYREAIEHTKNMYEKAQSYEMAELHIRAIKGISLCLTKLEGSMTKELLDIRREVKKVYESTGLEEAKELLEDILKIQEIRFI